ncbi:NusG domain II-containing protein [Mariniplasma anaerobium]|uniref:NusG domain-containing protein n=1 Tax=Mariniplasma anaerobium TaxID=2735436 RepID=A0A7U9THG2_9MOLU|nr:NusG domain II-containing protein [Mariniplasma anaerobium]BCR35307.1 hypothetical protein MPAN_002000 [Mariniplasma anaerobium]
MENTIKKTTKNQRDIFLIVFLLIIVGGFFLYFQVFRSVEDASYAHVYYGTSNEPLVTIDFTKNEVILIENQNVPSSYDQNYPIINEAQKTITLLGDYEINGTRQVVIITYDFGRKTVQVIEEQSPNNICSKEGVSNGKPLICLPNRVRVEFEVDSESDFTV